MEDEGGTKREDVALAFLERQQRNGGSFRKFGHDHKMRGE